MKSGFHRPKNDHLETASEKTDPKRLTYPLDTNKYIIINYSTNMLKYILHARKTNIQKSQRAKTKDTNKQMFSSLQALFDCSFDHNFLFLVLCTFLYVLIYLSFLSSFHFYFLSIILIIYSFVHNHCLLILPFSIWDQ